MDILLDTCTFLWVILGSKSLSKNARQIILDKSNTIYLSVASCWEISLKFSLKKIQLPELPSVYIPKKREQHGIDILDLNEQSALHLSTIPWIHKDPFDRILVSQAIIHGMVILTSDSNIAHYPAKVLW